MALDPVLTKLSHTNKRVDQFYVTFKNLPENISNVLGSQVKSITRPNLRFETQKLSNRSTQRTVKHQARFSPSTIVFYDDESSVVSMFTYTQVFRQLYKYTDVLNREPNGREFDFKFDIEVEILNPNNEVVEKFTMIDCFINEVEHSVPVVSGGEEENEITITVEYDDIDIDVFDRYKEFLEELQNATQ